MTNAELIAKIKAEIERLRLEAKENCPEQTINRNYTPTQWQAIGEYNAYEIVGLFLSTLESEKPIDQDEVLNEEIKKEMAKLPFVIRGKDLIAYARHFAQWGAEHLADARKTSPKGLEEAAEEYVKKGKYLPEAFVVRPAFIAGAKWQKEQDEILKVNYEGARTVYDNTVQHLQEKIDEKYELGKKDMKEQMLKEAVEADVMLTLHDKTGDVSLHTGYLPKELGIKCNDKVRIIIVKEDGK